MSDRPSSSVFRRCFYNLAALRWCIRAKSVYVFDTNIFKEPKYETKQFRGKKARTISVTYCHTDSPDISVNLHRESDAELAFAIKYSFK